MVPLQAVLFDYGDTLITYSRSVAEPYLLQAYAAINERLKESITGELPEAGQLMERISLQVDRALAASYEAGSLAEVDIAAIYAACFAQLGLHLPADVLDWVMEAEQRAWFDGVHPGPVAHSTLQRLQAAGLRLGIVSNAAYLPRLMRLQVEHFGLLPFLAATTWSSEVGRRKPDPAIYRHALRAVGTRPETTLFVGDRVREDVEGPRALGMRAVLTHEFRQEPDPHRAAEHIITRLDQIVAYLGVGVA
jgi:putative hydrolase of the HAD superfamily